MRRINRISLLLVVLLAAMTLAASTASAVEPIEVDREPSGDNCNPCVVAAAGEWHFNLFGVRVFTCVEQIDLEMYHDGTGHIAHSNSQHDTGACTRRACNGVGEAAGEAEFDVLSTEETAPGVSTMTQRFCLDTVGNPNATGTHCTVPVEVLELGVNHSYGFGLHGVCAGGTVEVESMLAQSGGNAIEIAHL